MMKEDEIGEKEEEEEEAEEGEEKDSDKDYDEEGEKEQRGNAPDAASTNDRIITEMLTQPIRLATHDGRNPTSIHLSTS